MWMFEKVVKFHLSFYKKIVKNAEKHCLLEVRNNISTIIKLLQKVSFKATTGAFLERSFENILNN